MTNKKSAPTGEILTTRIIKAPRAKVFRAWIDPEHLKQWWGPKDFTNTFLTFEAKPGGVWDFIMHAPDGTNYPNKSIFVEILENERIVFDHVSGHKFRVTATFEEEGEHTKLSFRMLFESAEECERVKMIVIPSNEENFDRLEEELTKMSGGKNS